VGVPIGSKAERKIIEILLVDQIQHICYCSLDYLVLRRAYTQWSVFATFLLYPYPSYVRGFVLLRAKPVV
jgi:hypothetical protein